MSVAIKKLEGVESVKVSLNEGFADIKLKPGNKVTVEQVREVVRRNGFTPKDAQVEVAGKVIERGGKPALEVTGTEAVYALVPSPRHETPDLAKQTAGREVVVNGRIPETAKATAPLILEVHSVTSN